MPRDAARSACSACSSIRSTRSSRRSRTCARCSTTSSARPGMPPPRARTRRRSRLRRRRRSPTRTRCRSRRYRRSACRATRCSRSCKPPPKIPAAAARDRGAALRARKWFVIATKGNRVAAGASRSGPTAGWQRRSTPTNALLETMQELMAMVPGDHCRCSPMSPEAAVGGSRSRMSVELVVFNPRGGTAARAARALVDLVPRPRLSDRAAARSIADCFVASPRITPGSASSRRLALGAPRGASAVTKPRSGH